MRFAVRHEYARTVEDILARRSRLLFLDAAQAARLAPAVARILAGAVSGVEPRVNPNGGAIAIGHPLGASGARLVLTAARELERRGGGYAVVSLCIGVGQGIALVLERSSSAPNGG